MNRRNFFKTVTGFVAGVCAVFVPKVKVKDWKFVVATYNGKGNSDSWKFYINGKEVDSSRAYDEHGALRFPFQGAKKGNLCTAKSPKIFV